MKTLLPAARGVAGVLLLSLSRLAADTEAVTPTLDFTSGPAGKQARLSWQRQQGVMRYRVEKSTGLTPDGPGAWSARWVVDGDGPVITIVDPESAGDRSYYSVPPAKPEVFQIQPPVLSSGGQLFVEAQCLPDGSSLVFEVEGLPSISAPLVPDPAGGYRVLLPNFPPPFQGAYVFQVTVRDVLGNLVCPVYQRVEITATGRATISPPVLPPVVDAVVKTKTKSNQSNDRNNLSTGDCDDTDQDCDGNYDDLGLIPSPTTMISFAPTGMCGTSRASGRYTGDSSICTAARAKTSEAKNNIGAIRRGPAPATVNVYQKTVLTLATPAGPPMDCRYTYTSRRYGSGTDASSQFDYSWNCRIVPVPLAAGVNASRILLFGGDGRRDILYRQADGTYTCDGAFRSGKFNADTSFTLTFADQTKMIFCPLVGAPWQGRLGSVVDASGVAVSCTYTASGQLNTVSSQFGQRFTFSYGSNGLLSKITDHTTRYVDISYYAQGDTGGSPNDVKSISCPQIPGQAPLAGPTTFTYTTGSTDDALNHNLLTVRNGENQLLAAYTYSPQADPLAIDYDTVATSDFTSSTGGLAAHINYHKIEFTTPDKPEKGRYRIITNDAEGRVTECVYNAAHCCLSCRRLTGYATPGMPVTSTTNRPDPLTKRRSTDPDFFETTWLYNGQHLCTRETLADGTQYRYTYQWDLTPAGPVLEHGNVRVYTLRAPDGEERTVSCDYLSGFGTPEGVWDGGDGNGGCTDEGMEMINIGSQASENGGTSLNGRKGWDGMVYGNHRTTGGTGSATTPGGMPEPVFASNPIPGVGVVIKRNGGGKSSKREIGGGLGVWDGGDGNGGCTDGPDIWGRGTNPDGSDCTNKGWPKRGSAMLARSGIIPLGCGGGTGFGGNLRPGAPIKGLCRKMPHRTDSHASRMVTSSGQVFTWSYNAAGLCTAMRTPIAGAGCDATYNALGQCTSLTILNGPGSSFTEQCTYNPATGWLSSHVIDPAGLHITTTLECDLLGRLTRCVDPLNNDYLTDYNALDCVTRTRSPVVGVAPTASRIACDYFYNRAGQCSRVDLEYRDASGALVTANPAYSSFIVRNDRGLVVRVATEQRPVDVPAAPPILDPAPLGIANFAITDFTYNDAGECVRVSTPAASRGQTEDAVCDYQFDERGELWRLVAGGVGALTTVTTQVDYDRVGAVTAVSLLPSSSAGVPGDPLTSTFTWDGFHRLRVCTCPLGNRYVYDYDANGGVTCSLYGEPVQDGPGSAGNVLLSSSHVTVMPSSLCFTPATFTCMVQPERAAYSFGKYTAELTVASLRFAPGDPAPYPAEVTAMQCSPAGLLMSVTRNGNTILTNTYDSAGRHHTCNADAMCMWDTGRDACGRVISVTRTDFPATAGAPSESFTTACTRDALGRPVSCTDGTGNAVSLSFDSRSRMTQRTTPNGVIHRVRWDTSHDNGSGVLQFYSIILEADTDGDGQYEPYRRCTCDAGYYTSLTCATGYTRTVTLDPLNRVVGVAYPDGTHESWFADQYGRLAMHLHPDNTMVVTDFDRDGRPDLVSCFGSPGALPADPIDYSYNGRGLVTSCAQGTSTITCTYDSIGNQLSEMHNGYGVTRTFNENGRTGIVYSDGTRFAEVRDKFGRIVTVSSVSSNGVVLSPPVSTVVRLGFRPAAEIRSNGVTTTWDYRSNGEAPLPGSTTEDFSFDTCVRTVCTNSAGTTFHSTRVRRDHNQQATQSDIFYSAGGAQSTGRRRTQSFNRMGHLISSTIQRRDVAGGQFITESSVTYTVDLEGRRLTAAGGSYPGVYTQNAANPPADHQMGQYSTWPGGGPAPGGGPLTWDDMGCITTMSSSSGQKQFVYNAMSQLVAVNNLATGAMLASYAYDATGRRTRSTIAGSTAAQPPVTTYFIYDGDQCVQELGDDGHPNVTVACSDYSIGATWIFTRSGGSFFPHGGGEDDNGGGGGTSFVFPILSADIPRLELIPEDDDITMTFGMKAGGGSGGHGGGGGGGCGGARRSPTAVAGFACTAGPGGDVVERLDATDSGELIFLTSDGLPRPGATGTVSGYDWFARDTGCNLIWSPRSNILLYGRYCPETGFLQCGGSVYSPQLGTIVAKEKKKKTDGSLDTAVKGSWNLKENVK